MAQLFTAAKAQDKPRFTHDCDSCVFVATIGENDWYVCPPLKDGLGGSVVARYGSDGPQYWSRPLDLHDSDHKFYALTLDNQAVPDYMGAIAKSIVDTWRYRCATYEYARIS